MAIKRVCNLCGSEVSLGNYLEVNIIDSKGCSETVTMQVVDKGNDCDVCLPCLLSKLTIGASKLAESGKDSFTWKSGKEVYEVTAERL